MLINLYIAFCLYILLFYQAFFNCLFVKNYSASHLRRIRLNSCSGISNKGLIEALQHFPLLDELDISLIENISKESLEVSCPLLNSLKYRSSSFCDDDNFDEDAFVIAETMHELRHLNIFVDTLTERGLLAILDGCLLLETLYLDCFHSKLSENLKKRCHEQIKCLQLPYDYEDYVVHNDDDDDDPYWVGQSENMNDHSNYLGREDEYHDEDSEYGSAISDDDDVLFSIAWHDFISNGGGY